MQIFILTQILLQKQTYTASGNNFTEEGNVSSFLISDLITHKIINLLDE